MGLTFFSSRMVSLSDALIMIGYPLSSTMLALCTVVGSSNLSLPMWLGVVSSNM